MSNNVHIGIILLIQGFKSFINDGENSVRLHLEILRNLSLWDHEVFRSFCDRG